MELHIPNNAVWHCSGEREGCVEAACNFHSRANTAGNRATAKQTRFPSLRKMTIVHKNEARSRSNGSRMHDTELLSHQEHQVHMQDRETDPNWTTLPLLHEKPTSMCCSLEGSIAPTTPTITTTTTGDPFSQTTIIRHTRHDHRRHRHGHRLRPGRNGMIIAYMVVLGGGNNRLYQSSQRQRRWQHDHRHHHHHHHPRQLRQQRPGLQRVVTAPAMQRWLATSMRHEQWWS
ncbi:hypothetical protein B0T17DRAFT_519412 [Bombardia bombarda]|uniref:Uncharacterized protein n=1 Tax=Bombardia bombarda TaxID=252184 RepID=A0AA39XM46_9PEZI|nr:hypothetical protein B0T17DRAFT_519412 [Bombardia bombarda]